MDRKLAARLKKELVIWLVTASRDATPQSVPVWFLFQDDSFLVYSAPGVSQLLSGQKVSAFDAPLRGVEGSACVYRVMKG